MRIPTAALALLALFIAPAAGAGSLIDTSSVDAGSLKVYERKGKEVKVSHAVPERFFGTYDLPPERINFPKWARKFVLRSDGTGYFEKYGENGPRKPFEWGLVVEKDHLLVGEYSYYENSTDRVRYRAHVLILKWSDGRYGANYVYNVDGRLAMVGPYDSPMFKR